MAQTVQFHITWENKLYVIEVQCIRSRPHAISKEYIVISKSPYSAPNSSKKFNAKYSSPLTITVQMNKACYSETISQRNCHDYVHGLHTTKQNNSTIFHLPYECNDLNLPSKNLRILTEINLYTQNFTETPNFFSVSKRASPTT